MKRSDWTLLALAAGNGRPLSPVQLQKVLFLLGEKGKVGRGYYQFRPYNFGPFSPDIYVDAESLERMGLARIDRAEPGRPWAVYAATPEGISAAEKLDGLDRSTRQYVKALVEWAKGLSFQQLVSAVYREFPDQRVNSIFVE